MKKQYTKVVALLLAFVLMLQVASIGPIAQAATTTVPDGEYPINFRYLKDNTNETSILESMVVVPNTGKLIVKDGKAQFENEFFNYTAFKHFSARMEGQAKAAVNGQTITGMDGYKAVTPVLLGDGTNPDSVKARIDIADLSQRQDVLVHIVIPAASYDSWYNLQLDLDTTTLPTGPVDGGGDNGSGSETVTLEKLNELFTVTKSVYESTYEGTGDGFYPASSKTKLYNAIQLAEGIAASAGGNIELIKAAYAILNEAKKEYEAGRISVSKIALFQAITDAGAFAATVKNSGTADNGGGTSIVSDGEYPFNYELRMQNAINTANGWAFNKDATQKQVNDAVLALQTEEAFVKGSRYNAQVIDLIVLNSLASDAEISEFAGDFASQITLLQGMVKHTVANISFKTAVDESALKASSPSRNGGFSTTISPPFYKVNSLSDADNTIYQVAVRNDNATDITFQGLSYLVYKTDSVTKSVYFSYNSEQFKTLNATIEEAQLVHDQATVGTEAGQYDNNTKAALLTAIEAATAKAEQLSATRPQLISANTALEQAVTAFKASANRQINYAALHATNQAFSSMDSYFLKPANVTSFDGSTYVSFTIKDSSIVTAFKVKENGVLVDSTIVSTDTAANTRVVKFKVSDLTALLDAQVHISMPLVKDPRTGQPYEADHNIRLSFGTGDATALKAGITAAQKLHDEAAEGTVIDKYPAEAKTKLQTAINAAKAITTNPVATEAQVKDGSSALEQAVTAFKAAKVLSNGTYSLVLKSSDEGISDHLEASGVLTFSGGSSVISFTPKAGVTIKKLKNNATGAEMFPIGSTGGANNAASLTNAVFLAAIVAGTPVKFTVPNLTDTYSLVLGVSGAITDVEYAVQFTDITKTADAPVVELPNTTVPGQLANGNYFLQYEIKKYDTENESVMQGYVVSPGLLKVSGSTKTFYMTLTKDKEITGLKFNNNNVSVESRDTVNNTRVVYFNVPNLNSTIDGWVKIDWPEVNYHHEYDIQIKFKPETLVSTSGSVAPGVGDVEVVEGTDPNAGKDDLNEPVVTDFKDIQGHWAIASIEKALELGIVKGYSDGKFRPNGVVTRAEFAVLISRALKLTDGSTSATFNDSKLIPAWAKTHIDRAAKAGLISGYANGTFLPSREITRSELASIIVRAAKLDIDETNELSFADAASIPDWAKNDIAAAAKAGYVQGKGDNKFEPLAHATRAEALTLIMKLLETT
ncbi:NEAT domain-containing protein [Paenibacillus sp. FSL H8-0537]|uniref:NEAT domain-containing protein n=1 Tax=Paenibacillus sp. FSL H8-0537 TaxID=2921399 RepID=UPI0031013F40